VISNLIEDYSIYIQSSGVYCTQLQAREPAEFKHITK